jgi:hypothetical protein
MDWLCVVRLWSAGRTGKLLPSCGNPSAHLATQNAVRLVSLLLWCLGVRDHGRTGTLGAVVELEYMAEVSQQRYRSIWTPWYRGLVVSPTVRRCSTAEVFWAHRRCPVMRLVHRRMVAQRWTRRERESRRQCCPVQRCDRCRSWIVLWNPDGWIALVSICPISARRRRW